jgi:hypothetical protein
MALDGSCNLEMTMDGGFCGMGGCNPGFWTGLWFLVSTYAVLFFYWIKRRRK